MKLVAPGRGQPLMVVAMLNAGFRRGSTGMTFLVTWAIAEADLERPLGEGENLSAAIREHAKWWKQSERTSWRELTAFRESFPGQQDPGAMAAQLRELQAVKRNTKQSQALGALASVSIV